MWCMTVLAVFGYEGGFDGFLAVLFWAGNATVALVGGSFGLRVAIEKHGKHGWPVSRGLAAVLLASSAAIYASALKVIMMDRNPMKEVQLGGRHAVLVLAVCACVFLMSTWSFRSARKS